MNLKLQTEGGVFPGIRTDPGDITVTDLDGMTRRIRVLHTPGGGFAVETEAGLRPAHAARDGDSIWVHFDGRTYVLEIAHERRRRRRAPEGDLSSPMPGQVQRILVAEGDAVGAGQPLLVVEAMKMQLEVKAPHAGRIRRVLTRAGEQVEAGNPLVEMEDAS